MQDVRPPLVSIITACFNAAGSLEQALESVKRQTYPHIEHIVIDGGSRDGTAEIIRRNAEGLAYWVSEPDRGIADAWNKGLARARGSVIGTLNADDLYHPEAVERAVAALEGRRRIVYGVTRYFSDDPGRVLSVGDSLFDPSILEFGFGFMHTTCFVPRSVYDEIGGFDTRYRIAIDTDFLLRCHFRGVPFVRAGNVTYMRTGGLSERRRTRAYMEYLLQLYRQGYPKPRILKALLIHYKHKLGTIVRRA